MLCYTTLNLALCLTQMQMHLKLMLTAEVVAVLELLAANSINGMRTKVKHDALAKVLLELLQIHHATLPI